MLFGSQLFSSHLVLAGCISHANYPCDPQQPIMCHSQACRGREDQKVLSCARFVDGVLSTSTKVRCLANKTTELLLFARWLNSGTMSSARTTTSIGHFGELLSFACCVLWPVPAGLAHYVFTHIYTLNTYYNLRSQGGFTH